MTARQRNTCDQEIACVRGESVSGVIDNAATPGMNRVDLAFSNRSIARQIGTNASSGGPTSYNLRAVQSIV
jgi:hypothetical protein